MALTSLQVCMDSSDWLQGTIHEDTGMDSSSSPSGGDMLTCSRPLIERRLRPQHDQALKCPRCDSTHTKFCYYNNYSLSQPRYFCKTCRRYWTKGGTLRNIPVGGGCRKNKKVSTKKPSDNHHMIPTKPNPGSSTTSHSPTHLQLSFPEVQFSHLTNVLGNHGSGLISSHDPSANFMDTKYNAFLENPRPIDFMEGKYDQENSRIIGHNFMGNADQLGMISNGFGDHMDHTFHGRNTTFSTPYGMSVDGNYSGTFMDACHRLMLPNYEGNEEHEVGGIHEVKPNTKLLALEWQQDQGCADQIAGKDHSFGYLNTGLGSWTGLINGYGSSAANPLV